MTCCDGCGEDDGAGDVPGAGVALGETLGDSLGEAEGLALSVGTGVGVEMTLGVSAGVGWALSAGRLSLMSLPVSHADSAAIIISTSTSAMNMLILCLLIAFYSDLPPCGKCCYDYIPSAASKSIPRGGRPQKNAVWLFSIPRFC